MRTISKDETKTGSASLDQSQKEPAKKKIGNYTSRNHFVFRHVSEEELKQRRCSAYEYAIP